jgi:deoxyhypusine synthase
MMFFHTYKADPAPLSVDIVGDIRRLNDMSIHAKQAGMIVLGGGVCKHQIANAMLFVSCAGGNRNLRVSATVPTTLSTSTRARR